jgi:3D (Asp-Asp-Asp) domain-containing protein
MTRNERREFYMELALAVALIFSLGFIIGYWSGLSRAAELQPVAPVVKSAPTKAFAMEAKPTPTSLGEFKVTHYCPCPKCCGEWADGVTYTGTVATEGRTIAVDPDVIPLGTVVVIDGQEYTAEDIGGAIQGSRIDIYMDSHQAALEAGVKYEEVFIYD